VSRAHPNLEDRLSAEQVLRERETTLAAQQASLRRVATLVAAGAASADVFAAVAKEVGQVTGLPLVAVWRYEADETATVLGSWSDRPHPFQAGTRWPLDGPTICAQVLKTGRPARIDDFADLHGALAAAARKTGIRSCAGAPIIVDGDVWGVISSDSTDGAPLPDHLEDRLAEFTELVATAISNTASREELARLADEQAALRRVATLVAQGVSSSELFGTAAEEAGKLLGADLAGMVRYEGDDTVTPVATWAAVGEHPAVPNRWPIEEGGPAALVLEMLRPTRIDEWEGVPGPIAAFVRELGISSSVGSPIVVDGRPWGALAVHSKQAAPLPADTESRLGNFTELVATAMANAQARADVSRLAEEQSALRRVATLVAQYVPPGELFRAVTEEVGRLLGADLASMARLETDDTLTVVASWAAGGEHPEVGTRWPIDESDLATTVWRTGRPARMDGRGGIPARLAAVREELGIRSSVASPIVVEGRPWGGLVVHSKQAEPLPMDTESRLMHFTELVATAMSNAQARSELQRLADEQAALRRVATLVARESSAAEVFAAVAEEVGRLLPAEDTAMLRYEDDGTATGVASWGQHGDALKVGGRMTVEGENITTLVHRTGRPARIDNYSEATGAIGARVRELGTFSAVGCPIVVEGRLWGVMLAAQDMAEPLPAAAESRVAKFTELIATAISNIEARSDLAASRARIVATTDQTRRRFERDLHDGVQQRLVSLSLVLRDAETMIPPELEEPRVQLSRVGEELTGVLDDLRELSRGIHPAILSEGGLGPALKALARRSAIPVKLDVRVDERLEERVEVTAYYVVSEALANAAKHARASVAEIRVEARNAMLDLAIQDDGAGGADPGRGSGLIGLTDRVEALGGTIAIASPAGQGTSLHVELPLED
jgi:GAF domain-containing protein